ncbi:ATP-binding protein [Halobacillus hunanensis]|uniref:ATP-binding protein n=1 Tax=Halobacillus hunanensis TaxID=578214 RepID=UPI0009A63BBA|nr:sensor histidine kinase [Halobacillus hunanensis]
MKLSLQTKILVLVLSLAFLIIILLTASFTYLEAKEIEKQKAQLALKISKTISFIPEVSSAIQTDDPAETIQPIAERIRKEIGAEFVVVGSKEGIRYSHPIPERIGEKMVGEDNYRALVEGKYYTSRAVGSLGPSLRGKSPIFNNNGQIIGIVSVGILIKDIKEQIFQNVLRVSFKSLIVLLIAAGGSVLLAKNIRKDTMGLEPYQIATLYTEKDAILQSIREGLLSYDDTGRVMMMNQTARKLLNIKGDFRHLNIEKLMPDSHPYQIFETGEAQMDQELLLEDKTIIVNRAPIFHQNQVKGVVASFRDKTEIEEMLNTISEVQRYSEDLRAQTHEFTNKLYVLSSLLQLEEYDEAFDMIQNETTNVEVKNRILFNQIEDSRIQAILLGKIGKASEKKVTFEVDANSSLQKLPDHINLTHLIVMIGNLVDNAFEAVADRDKNPTVTFFATDIGHDIIFEIHDNGNGIPIEDHAFLFHRGFTNKRSHEPRGYGLANVKETVNQLGGMVEFHSEPGRGTVFTVYLPKEHS